MPQIEPADIAAGKMQKLIHDQLEESEAIKVLRHVFFEMALLGTGVLKGPLQKRKHNTHLVQIKKQEQLQLCNDLKLFHQLKRFPVGIYILILMQQV